MRASSPLFTPPTLPIIHLVTCFLILGQHALPLKGSTLDSLKVKPAWYRFTQRSAFAYECPYPSNCVGGNGTADGLCREGALGAL